MAPIRQGDGTTVTPKGISEVRKGDGTVIYNAIPDSVVVQYDPRTWSEGDGTLVDDVGNADLSLSGGFQSGTLSNGDPSIIGDGVDDRGTATMPGSLEGSSLTNFAVEFAVEYTSTGIETVTGVTNSGDSQVFQITLNADGQFNVDNGNILARIDDPSGNRLYVTPDTNPNLDDGNRHEVIVNVEDPANNNIEFIIDGSAVSASTGNFAEGPSSFGLWDTDWGVFARNNAGSFDGYFAGGLGMVRFHDSTISGPTI
jgi:hypothetical protein